MHYQIKTKRKMAKLNYSVFIPTHVYSECLDEWCDLELKGNWLNDKSWVENIYSIFKTDGDLILVVFKNDMYSQKKPYCVVLYKGELK